MSNTTQLLNSIPVDPLTGAISVPIYQTSTFVQEAPGVNKGYDYSRTNNPTRATLEKIMAGLEQGAVAAAFSSGLAAIDAVVKLLRSGDEIVAVDDIYGGAYRLFTQVYEQYGIQVNFVDASQPGNIANAITLHTRLIWIETPTNPTLKIADIQAIAAIAKEKGCLLCVDNTFASPALQLPLTLGADIVVHSATKYLGGHSDVIAGIVVAKDEAIGSRIRFFQNACGAVLSPLDSWLVIRGVETLYLRVRQHCSNAQRIAEYLQLHPAVDKVYYPGLPSHPNHKTARRQAKGFGGVVSFSLIDNNLHTAEQLVSSTRIFRLAESLGGVKSLISHPANMTHKSIPAEIRRKAGVSDSLIRLSVGIEEPEDLIQDLEQALSQLYTHKVTAPLAERYSPVAC